MKRIAGFILILLSIIVVVHSYSSSSVTSDLSVSVVGAPDALLGYETAPVELIAGNVYSETTPVLLHNSLPDDVRITSLAVTSHGHLSVRDFAPDVLRVDERVPLHVLYEGEVLGGTYPVTHKLSARTDDVQVDVVFDVDVTAFNTIRARPVPADAGVVSGSGTYEHGTTVRLEATPEQCYYFTGWRGDVPAGQEDENPLALSLDENKRLEAIFERVTYEISVHTGEGGSVDTTQDTYACGTDVTVRAIPDEGYEFVRWEGDVSGTANPLTLHVDGDKRVTATFTLLSED